ncbi:MAG: NADH-ubiquinone oxidoreductase-F iron-sulfur binding region domain-containing protein [Candidatus Woesearchaeota archaeon]|jgi:NADH:ubiquinone oxidoreductase subunit F (NADH-binding)/(2Fe-2S) ferredoxin
MNINTTNAKHELTNDRIVVGMATCGLSAGAKETFDAIESAKLDIPLMKSGCIGMCYNEPVVVVVQNGKTTYYGNVTKDNVKGLIESVRKEKRCEELFVCENLEDLDFYKKQVRLTLDNCGIIDPFKIEHYMAREGYSGLKKAITLTPKEVISNVDSAGIRGRGGAGFPTGKKWTFIANQQGKKYIICNGDEGDPGAFMNRTLMESDPFRILEGLAIGAYATGADEGIIYTRAEYPLAITTLQQAITTAYENNLLGKNILGKEGFNFDVSIREGAGAFVCGEETALIESIEGRRGTPKPRPPFPAQKGLYGKPTIVNNVGTWGDVSTIFKIGVETYSKYGTATTKGTKTLCLSGDIKRTGIIEVPFGITLKEIIYDIGGGLPDGTTFKALFPGGPAGGCIVEKDLGTPLDYETMSNLKTIMGSGSFIVTNNKSCMVSLAKFFITFTQSESCGKCTPCREGTKRLLELLTEISRGNGTIQDITRAQELAEFINRTSLCGLGQFAPNPVLSTIRHFRKEYETHITDKKCPAHVCENLLTFTITQSCTGCGNCKKHCPVNAITGELKNLHIIDQDKCIRCGKCYDVCAFKAITRI